MQTIKFGTDGWRDIIAENFTVANVQRVAQAHAQSLKKQAATKVVIGFDTRFASQRFANATAEVFAANGLEVLLCSSFAPTPAVSFAVVHHQASSGVMITASHNPPEYNGYKIKGSYGGSATPAIVQAIEAELTQVEPIPTFDPKKHHIRIIDPKPDYFAGIAKALNLELLRQYQGILYHDAMGGAGAGYIKDFATWANLPLEVREVRGQPHPLFWGSNPEPIDKNLEPLMQALRSESGLVFGTATDGDADRVGAVLPGGVFMNSHQIFCVLTQHLYQKGLRGLVVKTVSGTQLIDKLCAARGLDLLETPIGFKYITDAMLESDVLIGGEESGGLASVGHIPERDGIFNSLLLLEAVASKQTSLAQQFATLETELGLKHAYDRVDLHLPKVVTRAELEAAVGGLEHFAGRRVLHKNQKDGIKLQLEGQVWMLFRPSGTEPVLRLYCEAPDEQTVRQTLNAAVEIFTQSSE
jgi:phosphomannomutase